MALSPAAKMRMYKLANKEINAARPNSNAAPEREREGAAASEYALLMAALGEDLIQLSKISSNDAKAEYKAREIEKYLPHIDGTIAAIKETGKAVQDEIFSRVMIWQFDLGNYEQVLEMAQIMHKFGMNMPQGFNLQLPSWLCSNIGDAAELARNIGQYFPRGILTQTENLIKNCDVPDKHRAKLEKAIGFGFLKLSEDLQNGEKTPQIAGEFMGAQNCALEYFRAATTHNPQIGVKKEMDKLERAIKNRAPV